jgi:hypothetical protein
MYQKIQYRTFNQILIVGDVIAHMDGSVINLIYQHWFFFFKQKK